MNLAIRDIRHKLSGFLLTAIGIGLLLMIVTGMAEIYWGFTEDALGFLDRAEADLWIVQKAGVIVVAHDRRALDVFDRTLEMEDSVLQPSSRRPP